MRAGISLFARNTQVLGLQTGNDTTFSFSTQATVAAPNTVFKKVVKIIPIAQNSNITGISGTLSFSTMSPNLSNVLFSIFNAPNNNCPPDNSIYMDYATLSSQYPNNQQIEAWIVKGSHDGTATLPVNVTFQVPYSLKGCTYLLLDGGAGEGLTGSSFGPNPIPITMNANLNFAYNTNNQVNPSPIMLDMGQEFCYATSGCMPFSSTYTYVQRDYVAPEDVNLYALTGTGSDGVYLKDIPKTISWGITHGIYLYSANDCAQVIVPASGQSLQPIKNYHIPSDAISLMQFTNVNSSSTALASVQQEISKNFNPPQKVSKGTCLVSITVPSPGGDMPDGTIIGGVDTESWYNAEVQAIQPSPSPALLGDINRDGKIDILDYNILLSCYGEKATTSSCMDPNKDHHDTTQGLYADLDGDGIVDGIDYNIWLRNFIAYISKHIQ